MESQLRLKNHLHPTDAITESTGLTGLMEGLVLKGGSVHSPVSDVGAPAADPGQQPFNPSVTL